MTWRCPTSATLPLDVELLDATVPPVVAVWLGPLDVTAALPPDILASLADEAVEWVRTRAD